MKKILAIIVLNLFFITPSQADDIKDFQIEGMSTGDSLLDFFSKEEIKNKELNYFANKRKYYVIGIIDNLTNFDQVEIYLKSNDKKYEIKTIAGMITIENLDTCLSKKKEIVKDIDGLFSNIKRNTGVKSNEADKTGKSKQYIDQYLFNKTNHIRVECMQWSQKMKDEENFVNTLNLVVMTDEISKWIAGGYK